MALIKCKECGGEVAKSAESCPHCGHRLKAKQHGCLPVLLLLIVVGFVYMSVSGGADSGSGRSVARDTSLDALFLCQQAIKASARNPSSADVPYIRDRGDSSGHTFVWRKGDGLVLMNDFGAKLDTAAVCRTDGSGKQIITLYVNGEQLR